MAEPRAPQPSVGELFAGIGGFGLAAQRAGMRVAWASEIDAFASRVYGARFPNVRQLGDITKVTDCEPVDCITAGFPCQDLSVAGKRKGLIGARSGLFWEIVRLAKRLRPYWLLLENVPGLLSSHKGRDFETVLAALDELGYGVAWRVLDAQFFGVPQRRRRVFIVSHLGGPCPAEVLFEPEGVRGDTPQGREAGAGVTGDVAACLNSGGNDGGVRTEPGEHLVAAQCQGSNVGPMGTLRAGNGNETGGVPFIARPIVAQPLRANRWGGADSHGDEGNTIVTPALAATLNPGHEAKHSYAGDGGTLNIVGMRPRRLTPRECERLQGFPDDWTLINGASDSARYRVLGNAVAVPVVEWILRRLVWSPAQEGKP